MKSIVIRAVCTAAVIVFAQCAPAYTQTCDPGPECKAADAKAQNAMAGWQGLLSEPSTHIASEVAYCSNMAVVEVARICEQEFRKMGDSACADTAAEQARQSQLSADSAYSAAAGSAASSDWQANCSEIGNGSAVGDISGTWSVQNGITITLSEFGGKISGQASFSKAIPGPVPNSACQQSGTATLSGSRRKNAGTMAMNGTITVSGCSGGVSGASTSPWAGSFDFTVVNPNLITLGSGTQMTR